MRKYWAQGLISMPKGKVLFYDSRPYAAPERPMTVRDRSLQWAGIREGQPKRSFTKSKIYKKG